MKILLHSKFLILFSLSILFGHSALAQTLTTPEPTDQYICIDAIGDYSVFGFHESRIDWYVKEKSETEAIDNITLPSGTAGEYVLGSFTYKWESTNYVKDKTYTLQLEETSKLGSCVSERKSLKVHLLAIPAISVSSTSIAACSTDKSILTVSMTPSASSLPTIVRYQYRLRKGTNIIRDYQFSNEFTGVTASGTAYNVDSRYVVVDGSDNVLYVVRGSFVTTTKLIVEEADTTPPIANCQNITVELDANGQARITAAQIDNGSSDNCGIASMSLSKTDFDCDDISSSLLVPSTDDHDNYKKYDYSVSINVWPISVVPSSTTCDWGYNYNVELGYDISFSGSKIPTSLSTLQGTLKCDDKSLFFDLPNTEGVGTVMTTANPHRDVADCATITPEILGCTDVSIEIEGNGISHQTIPSSLSSPNTVELTVVDNSGNTSTCTANVSVVDNIAPTAICKDITIQLDADGNASITADDVDNGSTDNCGIKGRSVSPNTFSCDNVGGNTVTLTVTDNSSNVSTCTATVTVQDNEDPVISNCPANITVGACANTVTWIAPTATDNCSVTLKSTHNPGDVFPVGTTTVTYTAKDGSGNTATCSFDITVLPVVTISLSETNSILCNGGNADVTITAGGGDDSYTYSKDGTNYQASNLFSLPAGTHTLYVKDGNGCVAQDDITINQPTVLNVSIAADNETICEGEPVEITAKGSGGTAAYIYEFYLNGSTTPIANGADYQINDNKLTSSVFVNGDKITVKVTDNNSCEKVSDEVIVTVHDLPTPTISGALSVCAEDPETPLDPDLINTEIYFTETGMSNYNWTVTGGTIEAGDGTNEITVKWKTAGTGTVSVNYENANGCSALTEKSETITIYERPNPSSIFPDN